MASPQKAPSPDFRRDYQSALWDYVNAASRTEAGPAYALGCQAVKAGIDTLDLSKLHESAVTRLLRNRRSLLVSYVIPLASAFFAEAIRPLKESQRAARTANTQMSELIKKLTVRTVELANSNRKLNREVGRRKSVEVRLRSNEKTLSAHLGKDRHMQAELRHLSRRLLLAQEDERKKISRELHDVIAQTLTGINYRLGTLMMPGSKSTPALRKKVASTQRLISKSVDIVYRFSRDLRPAALDDLGLIPALHSFLKVFMERTGIRVSLAAFNDVESLGSSRKTMLFRVAQEALVNASRHAQASQVRVSISKNSRGIRLEIADNGKGFDPCARPRFLRRKHLGLLGMKERVETFGGSFAVISALGKGTTVSAELPTSRLGTRSPRPATCPK